jgi:hypothetical protein
MIDTSQRASDHSPRSSRVGLRISIAAAIAACVLIAALVAQRSGPVKPPSVPAASTGGNATRQAVARPSTADLTARSAASIQYPTEKPSAPGPKTIAEQFTHSRSYLAFVQKSLPAARSGDAAAAYYIYAALSHCDKEFAALFRHPTGRWRTLDEALVRAASRPTERTTYVQRTFDRCNDLMTGDRASFGTALDWLNQATRSGLPIAVATVAERELLADPVATGSSQTTRSGAAAQLAEALKSRDPSVIWMIGELQTVLHGDSDAARRSQSAWLLTACDRGYVCDLKSDWLEFNCRFDQLCSPSETVASFLERSGPNEYAAVKELAAAVGAAIDAGDWARLGLESSVDPKLGSSSGRGTS